MKTPRTKRLLTFCLAAAVLAQAGVLKAAPDLSGTWIMMRAEAFERPQLSPLGEQLKANYDFAHDDPALQCIAASWTRVYSNPNTPIEITQHEDRIEIAFELFDIRRTIPLVDPLEPTMPDDWSTNQGENLGKNVGWYENDTLVVYSNQYGDKPRVLSTIREWAGVHQSALISAQERYRITDEGLLQIEIIHFDPLMYREPLKVTYLLDPETEWQVGHYGCEPEAAALNQIH